jgi:hypothetical protein
MPPKSVTPPCCVELTHAPYNKYGVTDPFLLCHDMLTLPQPHLHTTHHLHAAAPPLAQCASARVLSPQANPNLLTGLLSTLFNLLLFDNASSQTANQWAVTRPILSLLLADEAVRAVRG